MASIWPSRSVTHIGSTSELREAGTAEMSGDEAENIYRKMPDKMIRKRNRLSDK